MYIQYTHKQTQEEDERWTRRGDVCWAVACRQGDGDPAPSMQSVLQLLSTAREPHDEDDDVLGPRPGVSIRMWLQRLCVCVFVFVRQGKSQHAGPLSSKPMISIKCRCFVRLECFHQNPTPACFHRQVTVTSCSPLRGGNVWITVLCVLLFQLWVDSLPASEPQHLPCDIAYKITNASLCRVFSKLGEKHGRERRNNQGSVIW